MEKEINLDEIIDKVASLAKIDVRDDEREQLKTHFEKMLKYFQKLQELDLHGVKNLVNPHEGIQRMRDDIPRKGLERSEVFQSAPDTKEGYFRVLSPLKDVRKEQ